MNKKTLKLILIGILFSINLIAQSTDFYFTSENNKVILSKSVEKYLVEFPNGLDVSKLTDPSNFPGIKVTDKTYFITDLNLLSKYSDAYNVTPTYVTADGLELNYTRDILLKFKQTTSAASKAKIIVEKSCY